MTKISVIILASNREDVIENCLKSVAWADEKILINLGSTDQTISIAKKQGCKIVRATKKYNFSSWRNQGAKNATNNWLLYLDSDERITNELKNEILKVIENMGIEAYYIPRKNYFLAKEFTTTWPDYQLRLLNKNNLIAWKGNIHETPKIKGEIGKLINPIIHLSHRSLETSLANTLKWSQLEAENRITANHPKMTSWRFIRILLSGFWDQFIVKRIYREGIEGVIEGIYQTFSLFITYVRVWEKQKNESLKDAYKRIDKQLFE